MSEDSPSDSGGDSSHRRHRHRSRRGSRFGKLSGEAPAEAPSAVTPETPLPVGLAGFKTPPKRQRIHPLELALLAVVGAHLVFLPWALGTVRLPAQIVSLCFSIVSFGLALWPRYYTAEMTGGPEFTLIPIPKLLKFPIFWLGLALLLLVTIQGLNPSWEYQTNGKVWWMHKIPYITWLPHGVRGPFAQTSGRPQGGPWRNLLIYGSALLTTCSIWVGFTRRRTLRWLFLTIVANGVAVALLGLAERFAHLPYMTLFTLPQGAGWFATFIYKNHAGAYLDLIISLTCGVGAWYYYRGLRRLEKSTPGGIFAFFVTIMALSVFVSFARGATLVMAAYLLLAGVGFIVHQLVYSPKAIRRPVIIVTLLVVFVFFLKTGLSAVNTGEAWNHIREGVEGGGDASFKSRLLATRATMDMISDQPVLGVGSGSFTFIFPAYQIKYPAIWMTDVRRQYWMHAHNDWAEITAELGTAGISIVLIGLSWYLTALFRKWFWCNPLSLLVALGLIAVLGYSYWDFPFQCPAILVTWLALWPAITRWTEAGEQRP